jgi:hypothetical protein
MLDIKISGLITPKTKRGVSRQLCCSRLNGVSLDAVSKEREIIVNGRHCSVSSLSGLVYITPLDDGENLKKVVPRKSVIFYVIVQCSSECFPNWSLYKNKLYPSEKCALKAINLTPEKRRPNNTMRISRVEIQCEESCDNCQYKFNCFTKGE